MKRLTIRRLAPPVVAALVTSVVVAAIAVGGQTAQLAGPVPPTPNGQPAGQLAFNGKTISILSYSLGASNPGSLGTSGGGAGAGKVSISSLSMLKAVDANSPALFTAVASGRHFAEATLTAQWGTAAASATMRYKLEDVLVESIQHSGGGGAPTESLSLFFAKVTWTYTDASGTTSGSWDTTNTE
jgi:type VI secretion system secreted protein Hcp